MLVPVVAAWGATGENPDPWQTMLDRVTPSVLTVRMDRPRAFEGAGRTNSQATGFVIDAELGLVLTNRHVVTAGPVVAEGVFPNNEEVELVPVYRDPVHDFGLFRYDPSKLSFNQPASLPLVPEAAAVGVEVRVIGNDSGERLSILDGTIARLDRPAPEYGGGYSDFDTFYLQAASATSGGSSGSPVVDRLGRVIGLNAGGKTTSATSFYLPLERVKRAVERVRAGLDVPRGTLQTRMEYTSFDEVRRLGLSAAREKQARADHPGATGLLVVREVLPSGPAAGKLELGDVVLAVDGAPLATFVALEAALDDHVGRPVSLTVSRAGDVVEVGLTVDDLTARVPSSLVEVGGATVHDLSIHQARGAQIPVRGAYLADSGWMFGQAGVPDGAVLVEVGGEPIGSASELVRALAGRFDHEPVSVRYFVVDKPQQVAQTAIRMDWTWFAFRTCARDDATGTWPCEPVDPPTGDPPRPVSFDVPFVPVDDRRGVVVQPSLVGIKAQVPYPIAGVASSSYQGSGLVVDAARGLVVVDRDTVPVAATEVRLVIAGGFEIPAEVVALHEVHGLAVVRYDPADAGRVPLASAALAERALGPGDRAWYVGLDRDGAVDVTPVEVTKIDAFGLPASGAPRFRQTNLDVIELADAPPGVNGVLVDRKGRVAAFWASLSYNEGNQARGVWRAIPVDVVRDVVELAGGPGRLRTLGWELGTLPLPRALERGLPASEAQKLVAHDPERRSVLQVVRLERGDPLAEIVRTGDLVLAVDSAPVTRFRELEQALVGADRVELSVCRDGALSVVEVPTRPLAPLDLERVVLWAGVRVHAPDRSARLEGVRADRPYVSWLDGGSPAGRAKLLAQRSIVSVDGVDTPDLDAFLAAVRGRDGGSVRLVLEDRRGERSVVTVEPDERFFPTQELVLRDGRWARSP